MLQNSPTSILKTANVSKTYNVGGETIKALDNVSLEITQGEFVSIIGKSGSGKSTLMHIIGLLDSPTNGHVYINGTEASKLPERALAHLRNKEIGFVFQAFNLLQRATALENVMLPLAYSGVTKDQWHAKAMDMLKLVDLENRVHNKSNELSGGQKQRVAIARALVNDPAVVLADEPTGNLDSKTGAEIIDLLKLLNSQGKTVVIVTHDETLAKIARRQIKILDGKIV